MQNKKIDENYDIFDSEAKKATNLLKNLSYKITNELFVRIISSFGS